MWKNPLVTLVIGLMLGLVIGYVLAETESVPPAPARPQAAMNAAAGLPEGHPPIDTAGSGAMPAGGGSPNAAVDAQAAELKRLLDASPDDARLMIAIGNLYFDAGRWSDARTWYERAMQQQGDDPDLLTDLAVVYRNLQQPERALELLDRATAENADHWQAWYNRVVVLHFDLHRHDEAAAALRQLEQLQQSNPEIPDLTKLHQEVMGGA